MNPSNKILVINNRTDDLQSVLDLFDKDSLDLKVIDSADIGKVEPSAFDLIVLTGGFWYDDPTDFDAHYADEINFIKNATVPVLGICLGMQLIAIAHDGKVQNLGKRVNGKRAVQLMGPGQDVFGVKKIDVFQNHDMGLKTAPEVLDILGKSEDCIEIIKHKTKPILGVQFHPEKSNQTIWHNLLRALLYK